MIHAILSKQKDVYDKVGFCCLDANTSNGSASSNRCWWKYKYVYGQCKVQDKIDASMQCPDSFEIDECGYTYDENDP